MQLELLTIIPIAASAYVATNLDNLTLLAVLLGRYPARRDRVLAGFLVSAALLAGIGFVISYVAVVVPVEYLGLLGFVPLSLGLAGVVRLFRMRSLDARPERQQASIGAAAFIATVGTQLGNGTDTIITFAALFADSMVAADWLIFGTIGTMAVLFAMFAVWSVNHPVLARAIDRHAHRVTPFILIAVGGYILLNTATDL